MKRLLIAVIFFISCDAGLDDPLRTALESDNPAIRAIMQNTDDHQVQIIYTRIERTESDSVIFHDYSYHLDENNYFYPASTVKLPAAVLALEYLQTVEDVTAETKYTILRDSLTHTIADDIRQIFAVSDNEAYNRLYELLGRDFINRKLRSKGIRPVRIAHRLSTPNSEKVQRDTLFFQVRDRIVALGGGVDQPVEPLNIRNIKKGVGFMRNDSLIQEPMDFSCKNYFPLETQHSLMKRLFFPENFTENQRFNLSRQHYELLKKNMHLVPRKNGYDESEFYDSYGKFFIFGDSKERIPDHIKIYNKVGWAFGTLTETAYITDEKSGIEFLLSATILVNENQVFNDDQYEFESRGVPFLAQLGREIYELEKNRVRN